MLSSFQIAYWRKYNFDTEIPFKFRDCGKCVLVYCYLLAPTKEDRENIFQLRSESQRFNFQDVDYPGRY